MQLWVYYHRHGGSVHVWHLLDYSMLAICGWDELGWNSILLLASSKLELLHGLTSNGQWITLKTIFSCLKAFA